MNNESLTSPRKEHTEKERIIKSDLGYFTEKGFLFSKSRGSISEEFSLAGSTVRTHLTPSSLGYTEFSGADDLLRIKDERLLIKKDGKYTDICQGSHSVLFSLGTMTYYCENSNDKIRVCVFTDPRLPLKIIYVKGVSFPARLTFKAVFPSGYIKKMIKNGYTLTSLSKNRGFFVLKKPLDDGALFIIGGFYKKQPRLINYACEKYSDDKSAMREIKKRREGLSSLSSSLRCILPDKKMQIMINSVLPSLVLSRLSAFGEKDPALRALCAYTMLFYSPKICKRELLHLAFTQNTRGGDPLALPFLLSEYILFTGDFSEALTEIPYGSNDPEVKESLYYHAYRAITQSEVPPSESLLFFIKDRIIDAFANLSSKMGSSKEERTVRALLRSDLPSSEEEEEVIPELLAYSLFAKGEHSHGYELMKSILSSPIDPVHSPFLLYSIINGLLGAKIREDIGYFTASEKFFSAQISHGDKKFYIKNGISGICRY